LKNLSLEKIIANVLIFFFVFFLGTIIVGQFTSSQFIMGLFGSFCGAMMFVGGDHPQEFWIVKFRQFVLIVGLVTMFFMYGYGIYVVGQIAGVTAETYILAGMRTMPVIAVSISTAAITIILQIRHYFKIKNR